MPLENLHQAANTIWALWQIEESENTLAAEVASCESVPVQITNPLKRLEFLAGRRVIKELLTTWGLPFRGLIKDAFGKPFLKEHDLHISLSHSYPYVAAVVGHHKPVGIDLEQPKEKLLKIAARVLDQTELQDAHNDIVKHCIYWCAKETLVKIHGKKDLIFAQNLKISPFQRSLQGELIGKIIVDNIETTIPLQYFVHKNFVVVLNK